MADDNKPKSFDEDALKGNAITESVLDFSNETKNSAYLESNRTLSKSLLKKELLLYGLRFKDDPEYNKIIKSLYDYANYDVNDHIDSWAEGLEFNKAEKAIRKYLDGLDKQDEELRIEYIKRLAKVSDDETTYTWLDDKACNAAHPNEPNYYNNWIQKLGSKSAVLENKRRIMSDLLYFIELQKDGRLALPKDLEKEEQDIAEGKLNPQDRPTVKYNIGLNDPKKSEYIFVDASKKAFNKTDNSLSGGAQFLQKVTRGVDKRYENPLFPHDPTPNDIAQGGFGDCFLMAALSSLAKNHPEKIKENITENPDGKTCTVRLFSRNEQGQYIPVYVKVPKITHHFGGQSILGFGAEHCLWAAMYEQAIAASGLYRSGDYNFDAYNGTDKNRMNYSITPVKPDIESKYLEFSAKIKNHTLTEQELANAKRDYPQLFIKGREDTLQDVQLIEWPNFDGINSGNSGIITEILLGPEAPLTIIDLDNLAKDENRSAYFPKNADTPGKILAYSFINQNFPCKTFRANCPLLNGIDSSTTPEAVWDIIKDNLNKDLVTSLKPSEMMDSFKSIFIKHYKELNEQFARNNGKALTLGVWQKLREQALSKLNPGPNPTTFEPVAISVIKDYPKRITPLLRTQNYSRNITRLFEKIKQATDNNYEITCGSRPSSETDPPKVFSKHAYTITGTYVDKKSGRNFVILRNPWGSAPGWARENFTDGTNVLRTTYDKDGNPSYSYAYDKEGIFMMELGDFVRDMDRIDLHDPTLQQIAPANDPETLTLLNEMSDKESVMAAFLKRMALACRDNSSTIPLEDCCKTTDLKESFRNIVRSIDSDSVAKPADYEQTIDDAAEVLVNVYNRLEKDVSALFENNPPLSPYEISGKYHDLIVKYETEMFKNSAAGMGFGMAINALYQLNHSNYSHKLEYFSTLTEDPQPITEKWNELKGILQNNNNGVKGHLYGSSNGTRLSDPANPDYEILDLYINDHGTKMAKCLINGKSADKTFLSVVDECSNFRNEPVIEKAPEVARNAVNGLNEQERLDVGLQLNYLSFLSGLSDTFSATYMKGDKSSNAFFELDKAMKNAVDKLAKLDVAPMDSIKEVLHELDKSINAYEERCATTKKNNWRRNTRVEVKDMLKGLIEMADKNVRDPQADLRLHNASLIIEYRDIIEKRNQSETVKNKLATKLANSPKFKGQFLHDNIFQRKNPTLDNLLEQSVKALPPKRTVAPIEVTAEKNKDKRSVMNK